MTIFSFISLFGGLALFLYGMRTMGEGLRQSSSGALKRAMEKITNNPFIGFLLGLVVTCIIQSSTATIVLTSGLVGAGIITLHQSLGIIIGANVGTTVTGQIIRLLDINASAASWLNFFKPSTLAPIAAIVGMLLIMLFHFRNSDTIGNIAIGFGILFTGLLNMTAAVAPLSESAAFAQLFISFADRPVLGYLAGALVAFSIQSSSATIGILQALSITGRLSFSSIYSIIIGIYLGDCVTTAIVCSIGAKADAKRTGIVHILFNLSESILVLLGVTILHRAGVLNGIWSKPITSGGIANTHTLFNLACAILLLPVCGLFEKASMRIIKDDIPVKSDSSARDLIALEIQSLNSTFFESPALALASAHKAISAMANLSCGGVFSAMENLEKFDQNQVDAINEDEDFIDTLADSVSNYLVHLSPHVSADNGNDRVNYYIRCVSEFERIGDFAVNLTENAEELREKNTLFSPSAIKEFKLLYDALDEILGYTRDAFIDSNCDKARCIEPVEEVIDDLVARLRSIHTQRLRDGKCNVYAGFIYLDALVNIERIADQCSNIGIHTIALYDERAAEMQHDYIRLLHQGEDEAYNSFYKKTYDNYFARLKTIESSSD